MDDQNASVSNPRPAELLWTRYEGKKGIKHQLLFFLGMHDKNAVAMVADSIPEREIAVIRANLAFFRESDLKTIGEWIKKNMPISYRVAYRHFDAEKLFVLQNYGLKGLESNV